MRYRFSQHFDFSPEKAFQWCTDYAPGDIELMGNNGRRKVNRLNDDTLVLNDKYKTKEGTVVKKRLVRIFPELLTWTNTRVSKEGKYSQFLYQILVEKGGGSRLDFSGSQIFSGKKPGRAKVEEMATQLANEDSAGWRNLAKAMAKDLSR